MMKMMMLMMMMVIITIIRLSYYEINNCTPRYASLTSNTDITIRDNGKGTRILIDSVISGDRNETKKEA
jgi:hypothetical protein